MNEPKEVKTYSQLDTFVNLIEESGNPIMTIKARTLFSTIHCMDRLHDNWYSYVKGNIVILAEIGRSVTVTFYCINTQMISVENLRLACKLNEYGRMRRYALSNVIGCARDILANSYDEASLRENASNVKAFSSVLEYITCRDSYHVFGAHLVIDGKSYSCLVILNNEDGNYCDYICLDDEIIDKVIELCSEISDTALV